MTVSDLIADLQRYPAHMPVRVVLSEVMMLPQGGGEPYLQHLSKEDALDAYVVRHEGTHVLIESK